MADESFLTPLMNRDLIGPSNVLGSQMGMGMGGGFNPYMHTNLLGGVSMAPSLSYDVYGSARRSRFSNWIGLKNIGLGVGGFIAACVAGTKFHKLFKSIGKVFKGKP
ncbi:hypothetical protein IKP85_03660 [bacterium]|nr:hypothetical protein [bacterium]